MLRKTLLSLMSILAVCPALAFADFDKFYVSGDVQSVWIKPREFEDQSNARLGVSGILGYRWGVVALEGGITAIEAQNYDFITDNQLHVTGRSRVFNVFVDAVFLKAITQNMELKGSIGTGLLDNKTSMYVYGFNNQFLFSSISSGINIGARLGAGLQYNIIKHLSSSVAYKFQATSDEFSNMQTLAWSIAYMF